MSVSLFGATSLVDVAASQSSAAITSGAGTLLRRLIIVPETAACGAVDLIDGTGPGATTRKVFAGGGVTALPDLKPIVVDVDAKAANAAATTQGWYVTTGANVHVMAIVQAK